MHSDPERLQLYTMIRRSCEPVLRKHDARLYHAKSRGPSRTINSRIGFQSQQGSELPIFLILYAGNTYAPDELTHFQLVSFRYEEESLIKGWVFEDEVVDRNLTGEIKNSLEVVLQENLPALFEEALEHGDARRWDPLDRDQKVIHYPLTFQMFRMAERLLEERRWNLAINLKVVDGRESVEVFYGGEEICGIDVSYRGECQIFGSFEDREFHQTSEADEATRCQLERCIQSGIDSYEEYLVLEGESQFYATS